MADIVARTGVCVGGPADGMWLTGWSKYLAVITDVNGHPFVTTQRNKNAYMYEMLNIDDAAFFWMPCDPQNRMHAYNELMFGYVRGVQYMKKQKD